MAGHCTSVVDCACATLAASKPTTQKQVFFIRPIFSNSWLSL
jgi:hypothetical protein